MLDVKKIKKDFPIFQNDPDLVYLDSTATNLKPKIVIDKLREYYEHYSANVFRGIYKISEKATSEYESTRQIVADFIHANQKEEVIFTRSTTESLNLVAYSLGKQVVGHNDEIVTTIMEHHSNFVPWQQLAFENNALFKVIEVDGQGKLDLNWDEVITRKTKIVALTYVSNVLGTINPLKEIIREIKEINPQVIVVVDGAQAISHLPVNVQELGCDFFTFSSHKMLGPTGVGVLWGKYELLDKMYPFQYGGEMINEVAIEETTFAKPPHKFEAGTPHIAGVVALKAAIAYIQSIGFDAIGEHEEQLLSYMFEKLDSEFGNRIRILGPTNIKERGAIVAFTFDTYHPHDIAQILDESNIAIRAGHHCAMPLHTHLKISASARVSMYIYNSTDDIDKLIEGLKNVEEKLKSVEMSS